MDNYENTIGQLIRQKRKLLGMTQAELASKLQVTNKAVSKWETGESKPDILLLPKLADIFSVTTDELLGVPSNAVDERLTEDATEFESALIATKSRLKQVGLIILSIVFFLVSLLFSVSTMVAFDKNEVVAATGSVSDQPFLIIMSLVSTLLFLVLFIVSFKGAVSLGLQRSVENDKKLRTYCKDNGYRLYSDLSKEEIKQLRAEYRGDMGKTLWVITIVFCVVSIGLLLLKCFVRDIEGWAFIGYVGYFVSYIFVIVLTLINTLQWKKWLMKNGILQK